MPGRQHQRQRGSGSGAAAGNQACLSRVLHPRCTLACPWAAQTTVSIQLPTLISSRRHCLRCLYMCTPLSHLTHSHIHLCRRAKRLKAHRTHCSLQPAVCISLQALLHANSHVCIGGALPVLLLLLTKCRPAAGAASRTAALRGLDRPEHTRRPPFFVPPFSWACLVIPPA